MIARYLASQYEHFTILRFPDCEYERFKHPLLRKAFPLLRYAEPAVPLFGYLAEHAAYIYGDVGWPRGGGWHSPKTSLPVIHSWAVRFNTEKKWSKS